MNNFSSASAIVTALMSPKVAMLVLVCNSESKVAQIINTLNRDLTTESGAYYDTLRQAGTKELIPWLGMVLSLHMSYYHLTLTFADPYLSTLNSTFAHSEPTIEVDGHYLIDFKRCSELAEQINSIIEYSPPPVSPDIRQDVLEYVEYHLQPRLAANASRASVRSARLPKKKRSIHSMKRGTKRSLGELRAPPHQGKVDTTRRREGKMKQGRGDVGRRRGTSLAPLHEEDTTQRHEEKKGRRHEEVSRRREEKMVRRREEKARRREEKTARRREETARRGEGDMARWRKNMGRWSKDMARWSKETTRWREGNARRSERESERGIEPRRRGLMSWLFGLKAVKKS